jgi:uncharacterized protein YyaL (SSP411 family)
MPNRLGREKSPYLLQHARNPVDWYPWGDEAFARARAEDRPIFLSVGYSTCHWCHVMERESFESAAVARILNERFVPIKVDREERPDVDRVYMAFVQATTGGGGWPMSVFLTPELAPFFGGTYFPPDDRYGRPGFATLLGKIDDLWRTRRADLVDSGRRVIAEMRAAEVAGAQAALDQATLKRAWATFASQFDGDHGGFGGAPKFPRPSVLGFLLRGDASTQRMVLATQVMMARGGMYDQLGGGFHRYSVDAFWHVPHFEKMLYDQAQLCASYVEGWQISGEAALARVARETCDYVLRDLARPEGGFASAEDADSLDGDERREGAFYVWTADEIDRRLGADAAIFRDYYAVEPDGNAEDPHGELTGKNVLHAVTTAAALAERRGVPVADVEAALARGRATLLAARAERPRPGLDDKVLTAWNGMMIGALARAGAVLGAPGYVAAAERAARFIAGTMWDGTTLRRRFRDGEVALDGYLDDYAAFAAGLVDLFEATWDPAWLALAERVTERQIALFLDENQGGFFATSGQDPSVLLRLKEDYDGAEPAGSSVAALTLLRLAELGRPEWRPLAEATLAAFSSRLVAAPFALPHMLAALTAARAPGRQIVVAGAADDPRTQALLALVHSRFLPERTLLVADDRVRAALGGRMPWIAAMAPVGGAPAVYVCHDHACERPVTDPEALAAALPDVKLD